MLLLLVTEIDGLARQRLHVQNCMIGYRKVEHEPTGRRAETLPAALLGSSLPGSKIGLALSEPLKSKMRKLPMTEPVLPRAHLESAKPKVPARGGHRLMW